MILFLPTFTLFFTLPRYTTEQVTDEPHTCVPYVSLILTHFSLLWYKSPVSQWKLSVCPTWKGKPETHVVWPFLFTFSLLTLGHSREERVRGWRSGGWLSLLQEVFSEFWEQLLCGAATFSSCSLILRGNVDLSILSPGHFTFTWQPQVFADVCLFWTFLFPS